MSAKSVAITVAAIGAFATLGAAFLSNSNKGRDQSPSIQQTSSGEGAINVGHDAVITNNISKSPGEEAAERVQACEIQHGMKIASEKKQWEETIPSQNGEPEAFVEHFTFRSCEWPKPRFADGDGYLEIKVNSVTGPGDSEASGEDIADRISAPCPQLKVAYQYGHMGDFANNPPFAIAANTIVDVDGKLWAGKRSTLPFYPDQDEFAVLRSGHYVIGSALCQ